MISRVDRFDRFSASFRKVFSSSLFGCLACIACLTAILYWRRPDAFYNPQFWAEDGHRFFTYAFFRGIRPLLLPYAGYFHILARFTAWLGSFLPVRYAPGWYAFASWGLLALIIVYIYSGRFSLDGKTRFFMGLALVATSVDNEVFFNLSNWATLTGCFWLLLSISNEPQSRPGILFDILLLVLTGLNSPFAVVFWLLFLLRWSLKRTRHSLALLVLSLLVALVQVWNMPARIGNQPGLLPGTASIFADVLVYRFGVMFLGEQVYKLQLTNLLRVFGLLGIGGFYGGILWYAIKNKKWSSLSIVLGGVLAAILSLYVVRQHPADLIHSAGRHFYLPVVTLAWGMLLPNIRALYLRWGLLAMMFAAFLFWTPSYKNQVLPDLDWAGQTAKCVGTQVVCRIPNNPVSDPQVWFASISSHVFRIPALSNPMTAQFGGQIDFLGYEVTQTPTTLDLLLVWRSQMKVPADLSYFIQITNSEAPGRVLFQEDRSPLDGQYPTSKWIAGEVILDQVVISLPAVQPGRYQIGVGWYDPGIGARLQALEAPGGRVWNDNVVLLPLMVTLP